MSFDGYKTIIIKVLLNWQVIAAVIGGLLFMFAANYLGDVYHVYTPRVKQPKAAKTPKGKKAKPAENPSGEEGEEAADSGMA
jgi:hypothetical protein